MIVDEDRKFGLGSDHNVLLLIVNVNHPNSIQKQSNNRAIHWDIKKDTDFIDYQDQLHVNFDEWDANSFDSADSLWDSWKSIVIAAATEGFGMKEMNGK